MTRLLLGFIAALTSGCACRYSSVIGSLPAETRHLAYQESGSKIHFRRPFGWCLGQAPDPHTKNNIYSFEKWPVMNFPSISVDYEALPAHGVFDQLSEHRKRLANFRLDFPEAKMKPWGSYRFKDGKEVPLFCHGPADGEHLIAHLPTPNGFLTFELHAQNEKDIRRYQPAFKAVLNSVRID